jgi:SAM-dependent methyltransferase
VLTFEYETIINDPAERAANYGLMVRTYYQCVTSLYRRVWGDSYHFALFSGSEPLSEAIVATERMIADEGQFAPGMQVLDVGCGLGGPALNITEYCGVQVTGVDITEEHIEIARRRAAQRGLSGQARFEHADAMRLPFPDESFDRVYVFEAGCHVPDKAKFYAECARVLRRGGLFLGIDWMRRGGLTTQEETTYIEPICRLCALPNMITLAELEGYLADAGLTPDILEDVSARGHILRNWESLNHDAIETAARLIGQSALPAQRAVSLGGKALYEAARAGAFILGHWRARKPA